MSTKQKAFGGTIIVLAAFLAGCYSDEPGKEYQLRTDMYHQPTFKHNSDPLPAVEGTVQTAGYEVVPADSGSAAELKSPYLVSLASADTARVLFETYCYPCHGLRARGDGPVAAKFQTPPDLVTDKYRRAPDGYIYTVMRNGIRIMPPHFENTSARERWLIVSHLRRLQEP